MKPEEFKQCANQLVDYIVDYNENIRSRPVLPSVAPGYLSKLIPTEAPEKAEHWSRLVPDIEKLIMPGLTHWYSPSFTAFFAVGGSYPSMLGELLSVGLGSIAFNWETNPAVTELEVIMLDWLAKMLGLPDHFLASSHGPGGGLIQSSGSEGTLVALLTAKNRTIEIMKKQNPHMNEDIIRSKLVAYSSDQSHSSMEKAGRLGSVITRLLPTDSKGRLNANVLASTIENDKANGFIPFYVLASLGTTGLCAFDQLDMVGPVCQEHNIWLHIDAAYAGSAFVCPEFRHYLKGIEYADSFTVNTHKWFLVNFDCTVSWFKDHRSLNEAFTVDREYLKSNVECTNKYALDFRNMEIPLGRKFRALKLWFTFRLYGVDGLQKHIRSHCELAKRFEEHVKSDERFEIASPAVMGLVCFRIKGDNKLNKELLLNIVTERKLFLVGACYRGTYFLRYAVCSRYTEPLDVDQAWSIVSSAADELQTDFMDRLDINSSKSESDENDQL